MDPEKLAKVLALAESDHHGEAQSALRAARIMLARAGLSFRDLAAAAIQPEIRFEPPVWPSPPPPPPENLDGEGARRQLRELEQRAQELEQALSREREELARQRHETKRWHQLARETAEQLWDVGKVLETQNVRKAEPADPGRRQALIDLLSDPATAALSDREVARRLGLPVHAVGHCRRRLAMLARVQQRMPVLARGRRLHLRLADGMRRR